MSKEILQCDIKMPIMVFLETDMFIKNDEKFIVRKSSLPFYNSNHVTIIDSSGKIFNVDSIESNGNGALVRHHGPEKHQQRGGQRRRV